MPRPANICIYTRQTGGKPQKPRSGKAMSVPVLELVPSVHKIQLLVLGLIRLFARHTQVQNTTDVERDSSVPQYNPLCALLVASFLILSNSTEII
jgi:hypothetical protein